MKHSFTFPFLAKFVFCLIALLPFASQAQQMNYQGRLTDSNGDPLVDGQYTLVFNIYDAASGGTLLWGPFTFDGNAGNGRAAKADLVNGRFNVILGPLDESGDSLTTAFAGSINNPRFFGIQISGNPEIAPRQKVLAAPDALHAQLADSVIANAIGTAQIADGSVTPEKLSVTASNWKIIGDNAASKNSGNIGIGTETPGAKLSVKGTLQVNGEQATHSKGFHVEHRTEGNPNFFVNQGRSFLLNHQGSGNSYGGFVLGGVDDANNITKTITTLHNSSGYGVVGIGIEVDGTESAPAAKLTVVGTASGSGHPAANVYSIWATHSVAASGFITNSDERIKNVQGTSNGADDLAILESIEVTDYTHKDLSKSDKVQKKVIAQQVEQVFPQAVNQSVGVIPDIYEEATLKDGWIELATNLNVGELVRLTVRNEPRTLEVLEVRDGAFRTNLQSDSEMVFVYGRHVDDFRTVDYDAIAMLNVSATQELARKLDLMTIELTRLQSENEMLRELASSHATSDRTQEDRLARLERSFTITMASHNGSDLTKSNSSVSGGSE